MSATTGAAAVAEVALSVGSGARASGGESDGASPAGRGGAGVYMLTPASRMSDASYFVIFGSRVHCTAIVRHNRFHHAGMGTWMYIENVLRCLVRGYSVDPVVPKMAVGVINHRLTPVSVEVQGVPTQIPAHGSEWGTSVNVPRALRASTHSISVGRTGTVHHIYTSPAHAAAQKDAVARNASSVSPASGARPALGASNTARIIVLGVLGAVLGAVLALYIMKTIQCIKHIRRRRGEGRE